MTDLSDAKDWLLVAVTTGQIEPADAANRMSAIIKAHNEGNALPDIRQDEKMAPDHDWVAQPSVDPWVRFSQRIEEAMAELKASL